MLPGLLTPAHTAECQHVNTCHWSDGSLKNNVKTYVKTLTLPLDNIILVISFENEQNESCGTINLTMRNIYLTVTTPQINFE